MKRKTAALKTMLEAGDVEEGLTTASVIGNARLQRQAGRSVRPVSFTHGKFRLDRIGKGLRLSSGSGLAPGSGSGHSMRRMAAQTRRPLPSGAIPRAQLQ